MVSIEHNTLRPILVGACSPNNLYNFMNAALWDYNQELFNDEITVKIRKILCEAWCNAFNEFDLCAYIAINNDLNIISSLDNFATDYKALRNADGDICYRNINLLKALILKNIATVALSEAKSKLSDGDMVYISRMFKSNQEIMNKIDCFKLFILSIVEESSNNYGEGERVIVSSSLSEFVDNLPDLTAYLKKSKGQYSNQDPASTKFNQSINIKDLKSFIEQNS